MYPLRMYWTISRLKKLCRSFGKPLACGIEDFHGDNGAGLGASHQTGWTGVIPRVLDLFGRLTPEAALNISKSELAARMTQEQVTGG
jgi:hypothetical protein